MVARSHLASTKLGSPKADQIRDIPHPYILHVTETHHLDNFPKARGSVTVCKAIWIAWVPPDGVKGHLAVLKCSKSKHLEEISRPT